MNEVSEPKQPDEKTREKQRLLDQAEVNYTPVSTKMGKACAGCRWFEAQGDWDSASTPNCHLVYNWPQSIQPTGICDRYEVYPAPQPLTLTPMPVVIVDADTLEAASAEVSAGAELSDTGTVDVPGGIRQLVIRLGSAVKETVTRKNANETQIGGFKVFKDHAGQDRWIAWYSNNFEDRDKEFFSEAGFDRYVQRLDAGLVPMPRLRAWHVPGSEYGTADWVDRVGHFHVATGTYDATDLGRAGKAYDEANAQELGVSHGLLYRRRDKEEVNGRSVYKDWNTFEISPLPYKRAANDLTAFAVEKDTALKEAKMDQVKRKHLVDKFGEDAVVRIETATEQRGKEVEEFRAFKDFIHPDEKDSEAVARKEALDSADKALGELIPQLIEDSGEAVTAALQSVKAVTTLKTDTDTRLKSMQETINTLRADFDQRPRASASQRTVVKDDDKLTQKSQMNLTEEQEALKDGPLGGMFKNG